MVLGKSFGSVIFAVKMPLTFASAILTFAKIITLN